MLLYYHLDDTQTAVHCSKLELCEICVLPAIMYTVSPIWPRLILMILLVIFFMCARRFCRNRKHHNNGWMVVTLTRLMLVDENRPQRVSMIRHIVRYIQLRYNKSRLKQTRERCEIKYYTYTTSIHDHCGSTVYIWVYRVRYCADVIVRHLFAVTTKIANIHNLYSIATEPVVWPKLSTIRTHAHFLFAPQKSVDNFSMYNIWVYYFTGLIIFLSKHLPYCIISFHTKTVNNMKCKNIYDLIPTTLCYTL